MKPRPRPTTRTPQPAAPPDLTPAGYPHDPYCAKPWHGLPCNCFGAVGLRHICQRLVDAAHAMAHEHSYYPVDIRQALDAAAELGITPATGDH